MFLCSRWSFHAQPLAFDMTDNQSAFALGGILEVWHPHSTRRYYRSCVDALATKLWQIVQGGLESQNNNTCTSYIRRKLRALFQSSDNAAVTLMDHPALWLTGAVTNFPFLYCDKYCSGMACSTRSASGVAPGTMTFTSLDFAVVMSTPSESADRYSCTTQPKSAQERAALMTVQRLDRTPEVRSADCEVEQLRIKCGTCTPSHLSTAMVGTTPVACACILVLFTSSHAATMSSKSRPTRWQESTDIAFTFPFTCKNLIASCFEIQVMADANFLAIIHCAQLLWTKILTWMVELEHL